MNRLTKALSIHAALTLCLVPAITTAFVPSPSNSWATGKVATSHTPTTLFSGRPEPLATEGDWTAYLDEETTGLVYYFNGRTGESLWEPPTKSFPVVVLPRFQRRKAESKRSEYIKSLQTSQARVEFPEAGYARNEADALKKRQEQEEQQLQEEEGQEKWFDFLFEEEPEPEPNWFESVSNVFSGMDMNGKSSSGSTTGTTPPAQKTTTFVVEQEEEEEEYEYEEYDESGWEYVEEEEPPETPVDEKPKPQPGFFARMMQQQQPNGGGGGSAAIEEVVEEEEVATTTTARTPFWLRTPTTIVDDTESSGVEVAPLVAEPLVEVPVVEEVETPIKIEAASCVLPHPAKMFWGGEDAVFTAGRTFGVFDGVTGASKLDGVPLYSKTLASEMRKASRTPDVGDSGMTVPILVQTLTEAKDVADATSTGASTAVVASITEDGFLRALNLGDSGCLVIRNGRVAARAREISHYFDCPYQLSTDSPDKPRDGTKMNIELVRGDLIVMGSDGVFDNLAETDIVDLVATSLEKTPNGRLSALAKKISDRSRKVSLNRNAPTPYAKQAKRNGDPDFASGLGGKVDDVSCVVVRYA